MDKLMGPEKSVSCERGATTPFHSFTGHPMPLKNRLMRILLQSKLLNDKITGAYTRIFFDAPLYLSTQRLIGFCSAHMLCISLGLLLILDVI
jgi:hypothetical protein